MDTNDVLTKYYERLNKHRELVLRVGLVLGLDPQTLVEHDLSKFSEVEFNAYANWFFGDKSLPRAYEAFQLAWQNHYTVNPHHWQHWLIAKPPSNETETTVAQIPFIYIEEMVVDWFAMGIELGGTPDMTDWLNKTFFQQMIFHPSSREEVLATLAVYGHSVSFTNDDRTEGFFTYHPENSIIQSLTKLVKR